MIVHATPEQARGILRAMRQIAEAGGAEPLREADRSALETAYRYAFKGLAPLAVESLPPSPPAELRALLPDPSLADHAVRFLAVMAFDPQRFWLAWERGSEITVDTFEPHRNFWAVVHEPVGTLRRRYAVPPLDPAEDATLALLKP